MTEPIRIALFGNGFARKVMLPCLRCVDGIRLVGIASPNVERARETAAAFGIETVSDDHRDLLNRSRPDLVFVVTPPHRHQEQAIDALASGCHVVCEKPTALTTAESEKMLEAAAATPDRITLIDHELRMDPRRERVRDWIAEGRFGRILHASYVLHSSGRRDPAQAWSWWSDARQGGGALGAIGSHAVDALRVFLGEVAEVRGTLGCFTRERPDPRDGRMRAVTSDDFAAAWLRFRSGAVATITISMVEGTRLHRLTLAGTSGSARIEEQAPLRVELGEGPREIGVEDELPASGELGIPDSDWARSFLRLARRLCAAIRRGETRLDGAADFEDGHRNQLVLDAIRRSDESASWIAV